MDRSLPRHCVFATTNDSFNHIFAINYFSNHACYIYYQQLRSNTLQPFDIYPPLCSHNHEDRLWPAVGPNPGQYPASASHLPEAQYAKKKVQVHISYGQIYNKIYESKFAKTIYNLECREQGLPKTFRAHSKISSDSSWSKSSPLISKRK